MAATCRKHETLTDFIISSREKLCHDELFETTCSIPYKVFFQNYLLPNKPCIFSSSLTKNWPCRRDWVCGGAPNFAVLRTLFGAATAPVANCKEEEFSSHPKQDMTLKDYLDYWEDYRNRGYPETDPCLYLKDWHFTMAFPEYEAYTTTDYFLSDWLNEYWEVLADQDDYRFVYMGPKGSWTPFHADVYRSFSWSANICGRKLWIFYIPGEEEHLRDRFNNLVYDVRSPDLQDSFMYPNYSTHNDNRLEIIQEQGQIIFVPSGWHHQVYNLEDTISINHNWLNGCNIDLCWKHLKDSLCSVKKEISDCKDMDGWHTQCQIILKASSGIDYRMFYNLLNTIGKKRLDMFNKMKREHVSDTEKESYRLRTGDPRLEMFHKMKREHVSDTEKESYRLRIDDPGERPGNPNAALEQFDDVDKLIGNSGLEFDDVNKHSENSGLELADVYKNEEVFDTYDAVNLESTRVIPVSEQERICESLKEPRSYDLSDLKETSTQPAVNVHSSLHEAYVKNDIPCIGRTKEELCKLTSLNRMHEACVKNDIPCIGRAKEELCKLTSLNSETNRASVKNDKPCIRTKEEPCKLTSLNSETNRGDQSGNRVSEPETTKSKYLSPEMPGDRDHIMFDLYRIKEVLEDIMNDADFKLLNIEPCSSSLVDLQFKIDKLGEN